MYNELLNSILNYCTTTKKDFSIDTLSGTVYDDLTDGHYHLDVFDVFIKAKSAEQIIPISAHIRRRIEKRWEMCLFTWDEEDTGIPEIGNFERTFSISFCEFNFMYPASEKRIHIYITFDKG